MATPGTEPDVATDAVASAVEVHGELVNGQR
jgi:hypothetical protein